MVVGVKQCRGKNIGFFFTFIRPKATKIKQLQYNLASAHFPTPYKAILLLGQVKSRNFSLSWRKRYQLRPHLYQLLLDLGRQANQTQAFKEGDLGQNHSNNHFSQAISK